MTRVLWFRRDLRVGDHPALRSAARDDADVLPLFVLDPLLWDRSGAPRQAYLAATLRALDAQLRSLGTQLLVVSGRPDEVVVEIASTVGAEGVWCSADFGPYGRHRDQQVGSALRADGRSLVAVGSPYAVDPGTVLTKTGGAYKVFTPFFRAWQDQPVPAALGAPDDVRWIDVASLAGGLSNTVDLANLEPRSPVAALPPAGEIASLEIFENFCADGVAAYREQRDLPGVEGTSRLSAALKFGCVHPRQLLECLGDDDGAHVYRSELAWREFYADVLFGRPETAREPVTSALDEMVYDTGAVADERLAAWTEGRTGYPIVDAGMRQLATEAWMHNRVRMIVASFLVKDLHIDWRRGAKVFMERLVDGDLASNQHGWQWVAGTGTDASPYFRVFNPVSQSKKFDPDGSYLRRWVPEIAHLPSPGIHEPWVRHGELFDQAQYVAPIVDHAAERREALDRYAAARGR